VSSRSPFSENSSSADVNVATPVLRQGEVVLGDDWTDTDSDDEDSVQSRASLFEPALKTRYLALHRRNLEPLVPPLPLASLPAPLRTVLSQPQQFMLPTLDSRPVLSKRTIKQHFEIPTFHKLVATPIADAVDRPFATIGACTVRGRFHNFASVLLLYSDRHTENDVWSTYLSGLPPTLFPPRDHVKNRLGGGSRYHDLPFYSRFQSKDMVFAVWMAVLSFRGK